MKERPILFSAAMVRAILEGRKTQTRRVVKDQPTAHMTLAVPFLKADGEPQQWCFTGPQLDATGAPLPPEQWAGGWPDCGPSFVCPYGVPGDRLWVRERWRIESESRRGSDPTKNVIFAYADGSRDFIRPWDELVCPNTPTFTLDGSIRWNPGIFMPRWASRITFEITDVRVQRVQEISGADCLAEGIAPQGGNSSDGEWRLRMAYKELWDSINGKTHPWANNDWVWALTLKALP